MVRGRAIGCPDPWPLPIRDRAMAQDPAAQPIRTREPRNTAQALVNEGVFATKTTLRQGAALGRSHKTTDLDKARDELMSHVVRCEVLEAAMEHRLEWLDDTMDYMAGRWPSLSDLQLAQLEMMGREYLRPVIQHGSGNTALNRPEGPTIESMSEGAAVVEVIEEAQAA